MKVIFSKSYFLFITIVTPALFDAITTNITTKLTTSSDTEETTDTDIDYGIKKVTKSNEEVLIQKVRDVGYYLRAHKFNEYDRRYETDPNKSARIYFKHFPRPPLRALHWEVHKFCEPSFMGCLNYLARKVQETAARREDDTSVVMADQNWTWSKNEEQIKQVNEECLKNKRIDDNMADPFEGPLERYQWRVTASYYFCWYTMKKTPELKHFYENCDNFANCFESEHGASNNDPRVSDNDQFSCALYSFCPDPCCPIKFLNKFKDCWNYEDNPCYRLNSATNRNCSVPMETNTEFSDIILNRWNVTCQCPQQRGYEWNSRYGICVDVDECVSKTHNCTPKVESCLNLQGAFRCICRWGYIWDENKQACLPSAGLSVLKLKKKPKSAENKQLSTWEKFKNFIFRRNVESSAGAYSFSLFVLVFCYMLCMFQYII